MLTTVGIDHLWSSDMLVRPSDLVDRMSDAAGRVFTLPLDAARCKAREIIDQSRASVYRSFRTGGSSRTARLNLR